MSDKTDLEIIVEIKELLQRLVAPAVASHGGEVNFLSYAAGTLTLQMSGACAGCAGATMTLKHGIETMMMEYIPEVTSVIGEDDVVVNPYYSDDPYPA
jgi:Fe-S cluster biogenesis protein NfuA|tara:strand:+ start:254 stop:547 length:294 start_codon:yes stop_codon:yes gene_type:complete